MWDEFMFTLFYWKLKSLKRIVQRKVFSMKQIASLANKMDKHGNAKGGKECWSKDNSRIGSNSGRENQVGSSEVEEKLRDGMRDKSKGSGEKERRRIPYT